MHADNPELGGHHSNLAYQSMEPASPSSSGGALLKTTSNEVKEMVNSAAKGLDQAIKAMSQTGDESVLPLGCASFLIDPAILPMGHLAP